LSQDADRDASAVLAAALRFLRYTPAFGGSAGTVDTSQAAIAAANSSHKSNAQQRHSRNSSTRRSLHTLPIAHQQSSTDSFGPPTRSLLRSAGYASRARSLPDISIGVPHFRVKPMRTLWRLEYDHAQGLTGVLREGLGDMLEARSGPDGLPGAKALHQANAFSAAPLFKKLVLSDNPALGFRVIDGGRTIRGWVFISDLVEEEEIQAGELAKLMHSVGVFCEEIRLSNVNLLASHLAFSPFQRVLELDHTAIEDSMILSALERATCISPKAQSLPATAGSAIAKETTSLLVEVCRSYKGETTLR
ncbi:hypothetical protein CF319_g8769, partial [Tilletia indica]